MKCKNWNFRVTEWNVESGLRIFREMKWNLKSEGNEKCEGNGKIMLKNVREMWKKIFNKKVKVF
jgi:hypothetical protein